MLHCIAALVLLMDVSGSVKNPEYIIQRDGTAAAIVNEETIHTIIRDGPVALLAVEYSSSPRIIANWTIIRNRSDALEFANVILSTERQELGGTTATGDAVNFAINELETNVPCDPEQRIIDLSTDGESNSGIPPIEARNRAIELDIRINGIGISDTTSSTPRNVSDWLRHNIVTINGFTLEVDRWEDYEEMIRRKITLELAMR